MMCGRIGVSAMAGAKRCQRRNTRIPARAKFEDEDEDEDEDEHEHEHERRTPNAKRQTPNAKRLQRWPVLIAPETTVNFHTRTKF